MFGREMKEITNAERSGPHLVVDDNTITKSEKARSNFAYMCEGVCPLASLHD